MLSVVQMMPVLTLTMVCSVLEWPLTLGALATQLGLQLQMRVCLGLTPQIGIATVIWMSQVLCILQEGILTELRAQLT
jgi:hypothetical protein